MEKFILYNELLIDEKMDIEKYKLRYNEYNKKKIYMCIICNNFVDEIFYTFKNSTKIYIPFCNKNCAINNIDIIIEYIDEYIKIYKY